MNHEKIFKFIDEEINRLGYEREKFHFSVDPSFDGFKEERSDGYSIKADSDTYHITGKNSRSLLYGIYHLNENEVQVPLFERRGNVFEVIDDFDFLVDHFNVGAQNGLNEVFFSFYLWDKVGASILDELEKRGYSITLGGHNLSYLLADDEAFKSLSNRNLLIFEHEFLMGCLIDRILEICKTHEIVSRVSLWPEDFGISKEHGPHFLKSYIKFCEMLQEALDKENLSVIVDHIAYNAGLEWSMMELSGHPSQSIDTLFAFWGRNYSIGIDSEDPDQTRATESLKSYIDHKNRNVCVFEYYSDFFMLSEIFPPLVNRIADDMQKYDELGVYGVLNLVVPYSKSALYDKIGPWYPWKIIHKLNNESYAKGVWGYRGSDQENLDQKVHYNKLEELISPLTRYNQILSPSRVVGTGLINDSLILSDIQKNLSDLIRYLELNKDYWDNKGTSSEETVLKDYMKILYEITNLYQTYIRENRKK